MSMHADAARECNFDGLVGPTHNYAGLAQGNLAAQAHAGQVANPRAAALQGLAKMRRVAAAGIPQGWLPPLLRPDWRFLHAVGFRGSEASVLEAAAREAPELLRAAWSSSAMWTANAATVTPGMDTADGRVHFTPANLLSHAHRALEARATTRHLRGVFGAENHFQVHLSLPAVPELADEGAANHMRLASTHGSPGLHVFVSGRSGARFAARQTRAAGQAVARRHGLSDARCVWLTQSAQAIDAGVFHNDVIATSHRSLLLTHAQAFADSAAARHALEAAASGLPDLDVSWVEASEADFSLAAAVRSYVFNSQILDDPQGGSWLLGPDSICAEPTVQAWLDQLVEQGVLTRYDTLDLHQSMRNGGGPACLRLRVVLTPAQQAAVRPTGWCDEDRLRMLEDWVQTHYRDQLAPDDLRDPLLAEEAATAQQALAALMDWPELAA